MDVGARNRLLECSDCHSLYHQECHRPVVSAVEADDIWICQSCKDERRRLQRSPTPPPIQQTVATVSKPVISSSKVSGGNGHKSSNGKSNSKSSGE